MALVSPTFNFFLHPIQLWVPIQVQKRPKGGPKAAQIGAELAPIHFVGIPTKFKRTKIGPIGTELAPKRANGGPIKAELGTQLVRNS